MRGFQAVAIPKSPQSKERYMQRQIVVTITPEGEVGVQVQGHAGPGCKDLTRQLESALGQTIEDRVSAEYHQSGQQDRRQQVGH